MHASKCSNSAYGLAAMSLQSLRIDLRVVIELCTHTYWIRMRAVAFFAMM